MKNNTRLGEKEWIKVSKSPQIIVGPSIYARLACMYRHSTCYNPFPQPNYYMPKQYIFSFLNILQVDTKEIQYIFIYFKNEGYSNY